MSPAAPPQSALHTITDPVGLVTTLAYDTDGHLSTITDPAGRAVTAATTTASVVGTDTTTEGNWLGTYGQDGYELAGGSSSLPSYATVSVNDGSNGVYTWGTNTGSPYALRTGTGDLAATWYSATSFDINVDLTDGQAHEVTLYALDMDNVVGNPYPLRSERFDVLDAASGAVLASETIGMFLGEYVSFTISGNVTIQVTNLTPPGGSSNAVVSGIFFGGPVTASASVVGTDTATEGNWLGTYGQDGYELAGGSSSLPSYATVSVNDGSNGVYTWGTNTGSPYACAPAPATSPRRGTPRPASTSMST